MKKTVVAVAALLCSFGLFFCFDKEANASYMMQDEVLLTIGQKAAYLNGQKMVMPAASYTTKNYNTMIPMRFLCENLLKATVEWDAATNMVTLTTKDNFLQLNLNEGYAQNANGEKIELPEKVIETDGNTFVPLRFISQELGCTVDFEEAIQKITVLSPPYEVIQPIADFQIPDSIIAGQTVDAENLSYDPEGRQIVGQQWCIAVNGESILVEDLHSAMHKPTAGQYTIKLKVKTEDQVWSEWVEKPFTVYANEKPVIQQLSIDRAQVKVGELVDFHYLVQNEEWEAVTPYSWSYTFMEEGKLRTVKEKPRAFFQAGEYTVTLIVKDDYGNESEPLSTTVEVTGKERISETKFKFSNPVPGELFLNLPNQNFNELPTVTPWSIGFQSVTLLASNNPEKVPGFGILYQDYAQGDVRLRYHHRNCTDGKIRIIATVKNTAEEAVTVTIGKKALAGPSADILQVGQQVVANYLQNESKGTTITLAPGEEYILNPGENPLQIDDIAAALIDVSSEKQVLYSIYSAPSDQDDFSTLQPLAKINTHIRGTFPNATIDLSYTVDGREQEKIIIGREDAYANYYLPGLDHLTGESLVNNGNRGVLHNITIKAEQKVGVLLNPRGTIFQGVITGFDGQICKISNGGVMTGNREAVVLGVLEKGETKTLRYLAPSGSDSPILLIFIPYEDWE